MSTPEPVILALDDLFAALVSRGFYLGVDTHLHLREYLDWFMQNTDRSPRTLKYQLAALLCHDAGEQERFYELFDLHITPLLSAEKANIPGSESRQAGKGGSREGEAPKESAEPETAPPGAGARSTQPVLTEGKSGPVRVELKFPTNELRIWNLAEIDQAVRPLREKEWATVLEWDIPATIRSTIRAGGIPTFELRRRKRAPQYLMLIDQRGPRDHLAGLYAELAAELSRRDVDTVHYFYDRIPRRCWKDRRDYGSYTSIESLQGEFPGSRLLIVGEPEALLDLPQLRPSNLAADLLDTWPRMALLCTRPTGEWGNAELALCQIFPVVPANAAGLASLTGQWAATHVYTPQYWKIKYPEAAVPPVRVARAPDAGKVLENLRYYLGRDGYCWLSAAALYPELYYELTALLHDESIPPPPGMTAGNWDMNRVWWTSLLRLSRLDWFRRGSIPLPAREQLRQFFDGRVPPEQRRKVWEQLAKLLEFTSAPPGSFAADSLQVTLDWYKTERRIADPLLSETARQQLNEAFRGRAQAAALNDPLARRMVQPPKQETGDTFRILWVDDNPDNNHQERTLLQKRFGVSIAISTGTDDALRQLAARHYDLVISDAVRGDDHEAGMKLLQAMQERRHVMPFVVYTSATNFDYLREEYLNARAAGVFREPKQLQDYIDSKLKVNWPDLEPLQKGKTAGTKEKRRNNKSLRVFMVGAPEDRALRDELAGWLKPLEQTYQFKLLNEIQTDSPSQWFSHNLKNLEAADVMLFLASPELMSSGNLEQSLRLAVERTSLEEALLIPVILRDCSWQNTQLSNFQAANREPIETATDRTGALYDVCWQIMMAIGRFRNEVPEQAIAQTMQKATPETRFETKLRERLEKIRWEQQQVAVEEPAMAEEVEEEQAAETEPHVSEQEANAPPVQSAAEPHPKQEKSPEPPLANEQIQQLIAESRTEEALALLAQQSSDALLLQARYNNGKKQYNEGLIEFSEWQRTQAQLNIAALELVDKIAVSERIKQENIKTEKTVENPALKFPDNPKVYISSFNHVDTPAVQRIKAYLEQNQVNVNIASETLTAGVSIMDYIEKSVRESDFVLFVVSKKSLQSGWLSLEFDQIFKNETETGKNKWIPCVLDFSVFDSDIMLEAIENVDSKTKELNDKIEQLRNIGGDTKAFTDDLKRMQNHRERLPFIMERLKSVQVANISGEDFESVMERVLRRIRQGGGDRKA